MAERLRIVVNFKNTEEDIELYNKLKQHSSLSGYIKDVLRGIEYGATIPSVTTVKTDIVKTEKSDNELDSGILDILG